MMPLLFMDFPFWCQIFLVEPFWKPSRTPYVVSFWVRQSLRHAYAHRVFPANWGNPYAKSLRGLTQVRVLLTPNALWQGPYWKCKGRFLERLSWVYLPLESPTCENITGTTSYMTLWSPQTWLAFDNPRTKWGIYKLLTSFLYLIETIYYSETARSPAVEPIPDKNSLWSLRQSHFHSGFYFPNKG